MGHVLGGRAKEPTAHSSLARLWESSSTHPHPESTLAWAAEAGLHRRQAEHQLLDQLEARGRHLGRLPLTS